MKMSKKGRTETIKKDEPDECEQNVEQMSEQMKAYVSDRINFLNLDIKSYVDTRLEIYFKSLENKLCDFVDLKYESIHFRGHYKETRNQNLTRDQVMRAVETVFTIKKIDDNVDLYFSEIKHLRLICVH